MNSPATTGLKTTSDPGPCFLHKENTQKIRAGFLRQSHYRVPPVIQSQYRRDTDRGFCQPKPTPCDSRPARISIGCPLGDYGHKRACNKRIGPGGGTRRLHQISFIWGSWGRNRIDGRLKKLALFRLSATVIGETCTIANDNRAPAMAMAA